MVILRAFFVLLVIALCFLTACAKIVTPSDPDFGGESDGCGDFLVFRFNERKTLVVAVHVNEKTHVLTATPAEIDIQPDLKDVRVEVLQFRKPANDYFCDDVGGDAPPIATWQAVSGKIIIEQNQPLTPGTRGNATHKVSVVLRDVRLRERKTAREANLGEVWIKDVFVGWMAG